MSSVWLAASAVWYMTSRLLRARASQGLSESASRPKIRLPGLLADRTDDPRATRQLILGHDIDTVRPIVGGQFFAGGEDHQRASELHAVPAAQHVMRSELTVDVGAVRAAQIHQIVPPVLPVEFRVKPRDFRIMQLNGVALFTSDTHTGILQLKPLALVVPLDHKQRRHRLAPLLPVIRRVFDQLLDFTNQRTVMIGFAHQVLVGCQVAPTQISQDHQFRAVAGQFAGRTRRESMCRPRRRTPSRERRPPVAAPAQFPDPGERRAPRRSALRAVPTLCGTHSASLPIDRRSRLVFADQEQDPASVAAPPCAQLPVWRSPEWHSGPQKLEPTTGWPLSSCGSRRPCLPCLACRGRISRATIRVKTDSARLRLASPVTA